MQLLVKSNKKKSTEGQIKCNCMATINLDLNLTFALSQRRHSFQASLYTETVKCIVCGMGIAKDPSLLITCACKQTYIIGWRLFICTRNFNENMNIISESVMIITFMVMVMQWNGVVMWHFERRHINSIYRRDHN